MHHVFDMLVVGCIKHSSDVTEPILKEVDKRVRARVVVANKKPAELKEVAATKACGVVRRARQIRASGGAYERSPDRE